MDEFAAALKQLKAFNRMVLDHPELSKRLVHGDHDFLQWRQGKIFVAFREHHRKTQATVGVAATLSKRASSSRLKWLWSGLAACTMTIWSLRQKKDVIIFSVDKISAEKDHDFRIDGLYRFLREKRISFVEVFHAQLGPSLLAHAKSRHRAAVYREAFEFLASIWFRWCRCRLQARRLAAALPCAEFEEADRPFVRHLVEKLLGNLHASRFEVRWYRRVLKRIRPRVVLSIDDTRYYQELCAAARAEGIPFYAFQHGHFTKYHAGWLASGASTPNDAQPDALFVWSPYWKNELRRLGTNIDSDRIRVGGNPKGLAVATEAPPYIPPKVGERLGLLVPFESDVVFEEVRALLKKLIATEHVKVWLKTRPDWDRDEQLQRYGLDELSKDQAEAVPDHRPFLSHMHAVAGVYSTFLYDALATMRPVFIFKTSMDVGEGMVVNGLADALDVSSGDPVTSLIAACHAAAPQLQDRLDRYQGGASDISTTLTELCRFS